MRILLAGVDKDGRAAVEATVRRALADQGSAPATVSLVRIGARWSVTIEGPGSTRLSFTAEQDRLGATIREAVGSEPAAPPTVRTEPEATQAAPPAGSSESRVQAECESCRQAFVVVYEARDGEPEVCVAVACPHCWHINRATVGEWAAAGHDFRAEKA